MSSTYETCKYVKYDIYSPGMRAKDKPLVWLHGEVKTPPFSAAARLETGYLLRALQGGEYISMPRSRPMSVIGRRCHELRITDESKIWRIIYRLEPDAVVILEVFEMKTNQTPKAVIEICRKRLRMYESESL